MKKLHNESLYCWSVFDEQRNLDFHSFLWLREEGNVVIDPLPLSVHDQEHLDALGGVSIVVVTNSDHCRDAENIAQRYHAQLCGPLAEQETFPINCDRWLTDNDVVVPELSVFALEGSKTPGELALLLAEKTLITGDLIRCHQAGRLCLLPVAKLADKHKAQDSVRRLMDRCNVEVILTGDGWPIFQLGSEALRHLVASF